MVNQYWIDSVWRSISLRRIRPRSRWWTPASPTWLTTSSGPGLCLMTRPAARRRQHTSNTKSAWTWRKSTAPRDSRSRTGAYRSGMGAYAGAARRRVHLVTVLLLPPSGHRPGRRQARNCPYPSDMSPPDATMKPVDAPTTWSSPPDLGKTRFDWESTCALLTWWLYCRWMSCVLYAWTHTIPHGFIYMYRSSARS